MTERATKKRRREPPDPRSDLRLQDLPEGAEKQRVLQAQRYFEAGDFVAMRKVTGELEKSSSKDVRAAATALRSRVGIDKVQVAVVCACALAIFLVALKYLS